MASEGKSSAATTLDSAEPKTPLWLTFLGGALFLLAAVYVLATREPEAEGANADAPSAAAAPAAELPAAH
jgi:hypothetical protein